MPAASRFQGHGCTRCCTRPAVPRRAGSRSRPRPRQRRSDTALCGLPSGAQLPPAAPPRSCEARRNLSDTRPRVQGIPAPTRRCLCRSPPPDSRSCASAARTARQGRSLSADTQGRFSPAPPDTRSCSAHRRFSAPLRAPPSARRTSGLSRPCAPCCMRRSPRCCYNRLRLRLPRLRPHPPPGPAGSAWALPPPAWSARPARPAGAVPRSASRACSALSA